MNWIFSRLALAGMIFKILAFGVLGAGVKYEVIDFFGYVAVRQTDSGEIYRTDTRISALPPSDLELLREGIPCEDKEAVAAVLENFCS